MDLYKPGDLVKLSKIALAELDSNPDLFKGLDASSIMEVKELRGCAVILKGKCEILHIDWLEVWRG